MADLSLFVEVCRRASRVAGPANSRVLHTMSEPLDAQLANMAADAGGALSLSVLSPFFSSYHGVKQLATKLSCEKVSVVVPPRAPEIFDFTASVKAGFKVSPVASELFVDTRSLHAKLFEIQCRRGSLVVTGSANATTAALSGRNVEAAVVRKYDQPYAFGWRASGTHSGNATGESPPEELRAPCIVVYLNGRHLIGRVVGPNDVEGDWQGLLSSGARRDSIGCVTVDEQGRFRTPVPTSADPIARSSSVQLILERSQAELRGWVILEEILRAVREKGPIARSFGRVLSGTSTSADIAAFLDYLIRAPQETLDAADRQRGARADRMPPAEPQETVDFSQLNPISAFDMGSRWRSSVPRGGFEGLLDALLRHFASSLPDVDDDAGDDEDEEVTTTVSTAARGEAKKRAKRPPVSLARRAFASVFGLIEQRPAGVGRIPGLYSLFDMILQIAPRCEDGDAFAAECLTRWLAAARGCRDKQGRLSPLDRSVAAVLTKTVMDDPRQAAIAHARLQEWFESEIGEEMKQSLAPRAESIDERRIVSGASQAGWDSAWNTMLATTTAWGGC